MEEYSSVERLVPLCVDVCQLAPEGNKKLNEEEEVQTSAAGEKQRKKGKAAVQ